jgi:hypothetical protein
MGPEETSQPFKHKPELPVTNNGDAIRQIVGDINCKLGGCHGKGYSGIRILADGTQLVQMCKCGRWGETDFVVISKKIQELVDAQARDTAMLITKSESLESSFNSSLKMVELSVSNYAQNVIDTRKELLGDTILRWFQKRKK